jgi:hypothetical protein
MGGGGCFCLINKIALKNKLGEILLQIGKKHRFFKRNILISVSCENRLTLG